MAGQVLNAELRITARDQTAAGLKSAARNVGVTARDMDRAFSGMGRTVAALAAFEVGRRTIDKLAESAIGTDRALRSIGVTSGATAAEIEDSFKRMTLSGAVSRRSSRDLLDIANSLVAAGLSLEDATGSAAAAGRLATAYGAEMADIGNLTSAMFTGFGANVGDVTRYFDAVAAGSKAGQVEVKDLASGLGSLAGPAKMLGMDTLAGFQQIVALAEVSRTTAGDNAEAINNARNALLKMMAPDVQKNFRKMGVDWQRSMKEGAKSGKDLLEVLRDAVMTATKGDMSKLTQLFPDQQAAAAIAALTGNWDTYAKTLERVRSANGEVMRDAERAVKTVSGSVDHLVASTENWLSMLSRRPWIAGTLNGIAGMLDKSTAVGTLQTTFDETYAASDPTSRIGGGTARMFNPVEGVVIDRTADALLAGKIDERQAMLSIRDRAWRLAGGAQQELDREFARGRAYGRLTDRATAASMLPKPRPATNGDVPAEGRTDGMPMPRPRGAVEAIPSVPATPVAPTPERAPTGTPRAATGIFDPPTRTEALDWSRANGRWQDWAPPADMRPTEVLPMTNAGSAFRADITVPPLGASVAESRRMVDMATAPTPRQPPPSPFVGARYAVPEVRAESTFPARPEPLGAGGFTRAEAVMAGSLDRLAGMFDAAATRIGAVTMAQGAFDPVTTAHDPRLLPPLPMRAGDDGTVTAPRLKTTPMGADPGEGARMVALLESLRAPGAIKAEVKGPVEAELKGTAKVTVELRAPPGVIAAARSESSGHIQTNVGTSMPHVERPGGIGSR